jgi:hypothetical protein
VIPAGWLAGRPGQALAVGCGVLVVALVWLGLIDPLWSWYGERQVLLEQRQMLLGRMQGLVARLPALQAASAAQPGGAEAAVGLLPGGSDAVAAAALQETVQKMATAAGASLAAVETLPAAVRADHWHQVSLRISLNAPWPVLIDLMHAVGQGPARIFIGDVHFHSPVILAHPAVLPIQASMVLYGFRLADVGT